VPRLWERNAAGFASIVPRQCSVNSAKGTLSAKKRYVVSLTCRETEGRRPTSEAPRSPVLGQERMEVAPSVVHEHDRLAVDQRPTHRQTANRLGDRREPIGEVRAATAPHLGALTELADEDAEAVMLDFVQPAGSGRRAINERRLARADEADRRNSLPTGGRGGPRLARRNHQADGGSLAAG
jgi:hypothetical protein